MNTDPVRARDVTLARWWRAECHRKGCAWPGGTYTRDRAQADAERQAHLATHRSLMETLGGDGAQGVLL